MKFKMVHENYNVADLNRSIDFYEKALGLHEVRRKNGNGFIIVYLGNAESSFEVILVISLRLLSLYSMAKFYGIIYEKTVSFYSFL